MQTEGNVRPAPGKCQICNAEPAASQPHLGNARCCDACLDLFDWFRRWVVKEADIAPGDVALSTSLIEVHKGDSFGLVELLMELEDEFGVLVPEGAESRLNTIGDAIRFIRYAKSNATRSEGQRRFKRGA